MFASYVAKVSRRLLNWVVTLAKSTEGSNRNVSKEGRHVTSVCMIESCRKWSNDSAFRPQVLEIRKRQQNIRILCFVGSEPNYLDQTFVGKTCRVYPMTQMKLFKRVCDVITKYRMIHLIISVRLSISLVLFFIKVNIAFYFHIFEL